MYSVMKKQIRLHLRELEHIQTYFNQLSCVPVALSLCFFSRGRYGSRSTNATTH